MGAPRMPTPKRSIAPRLSSQPRTIFRAAMLRIGPTFHNHTPYARVHSAFPPHFEGAIRQRALPRYRKLTLFCDFPRLHIALSLDKNMADENDARGGSAARELATLNRRRGDLAPPPSGLLPLSPALRPRPRMRGDPSVCRAVQRQSKVSIRPRCGSRA